MIQQDLKERTCLDHPQNKVILTCLNKYCHQNKLICCFCLANHAGHVESLCDKQKVEEKIKLGHQNQEGFLKILNSQFEELNLQFNQVKQAIGFKYLVTIQKSNFLNNEQFSEYIAGLVQFEETKETILNNFQEGIANLSNKLNYCQQIIGLSELSYLKFSDEDAKQAQDLYNKGKQYYEKKEYEKAISMFKQALQFENNNIQTLIYLGNSLRSQNKHEESIEYCDKAIVIDTENLDALFGKARSLKELSKYQEAIKIFDRMIEINPKQTPPYFHKGLSLKKIEEYDLAIESFDKAIQIDPQSFQYHYEKGECLRLSKKFKLAFQEYEQALLINQNSELTLSNICKCLLTISLLFQVYPNWEILMMQRYITKKFLKLTQRAQQNYLFQIQSSNKVMIISAYKKVWQIKQQINSVQ